MFLGPERERRLLYEERLELPRTPLTRRMLALLIGVLVLLRFVVEAPNIILSVLALGVGVSTWPILEFVLHRRRKRAQDDSGSAEA